MQDAPRRSRQPSGDALRDDGPGGNPLTASGAQDRALKPCHDHVMVLDWRALHGLSPAQLTSVLQAELHIAMRGLSEEEEDELLSRLPSPLRVLWVLDWLDFEAAQGSLLAYFFNSHGRHARLAVQALRDIGAVQMPSVVLQVTESVTAARGEWAACHDELDHGPVRAVVQPYAGLSNAKQLSELTDQYWAAAEEVAGDPTRPGDRASPHARSPGHRHGVLVQVDAQTRVVNRGHASLASTWRVSLDQTSSGCHPRLSAWRSIASCSGSGMSSRTSCAQRQPTAILAAHASASSREATSTTENPPRTSLVSG
jgi:hypothetical protein